MSKLREVLNKLFGMPDTSDQVMRRDQWTRDIVRLMFIVVMIATGVILLGVFARIFTFFDTIPIYVIFFATMVAYIGARHHGWTWARFLPVLICLGTGLYFSYVNGFRNTGLFYALAILLTGMLFGIKISWFVAFLAISGYSLLGAHFHSDEIYTELPAIVTTFFLLLGLTFLLAYFDNSLNRVISDLIKGNQKLKKEISLRQQAEAASEKQESLYTRLANNTSDLVCEMTPDGIFEYISPSYFTTLGYTPDSLVGTSVFDLVHPEDLQKARDAMEKVRVSLRPDRVRLRSRHANGQYIHTEVSGSPLINGNGELYGYILSSRDITQQVAAEEAIKQSEAKFRNIIESIPLGIHMYTLCEDNTLVFAGYNPAACTMLGVDLKPFLGKQILDAFPSLTGTEIPDAYRSVAKNGGRWNRGQFTYKDENVHGVYEIQAFQYSPGKMVAIFEDITSQIASQEALHSSQEMFSKAFHTSPDAININRMNDGMYININQGFTNLTGFTREDAIGVSSLKMDIWANPSDRDLLVKGLLKNGAVNNLEAGFRFKDGTVKTGLMSARVVEIDHEQCILSITRDISERKQAEIDLQTAHTQLEEAYDATLEGWVRALEIREHDTADHSRRVVELTIAMAKRFGITGEALVHTQRGALLHDIGKMGVPDNILLKPGALSVEEWTIMRYHPEYAKSLLQDIEYLVPAMDIPYCHHERWNGAGYPRGISGEEIPLSARIFAVIDVYDALLSNRPYRPAWSREDVIQYLIDQKGVQFDPHVVDEFLALLDNK
jgi:PAS domain S-box-containing protein